MNDHRGVPRLLAALVYLLAIAVPVVLGLAAVGSSPYLLERVVPAEYRDTVAAFGDGAARLSGGNSTLFGSGPPEVSAHAVPQTIPGTPIPYRDDWSPRRLDEIPVPEGLVPGVDFNVETTDDGHIAHWPCGEEIPVRTFDAPPGSEPDLVWAVDTLAAASGLPLRYAGPGAEEDREAENAEGAISVAYGDHPTFENPSVAGVGGATVWTGGLITKGEVTLKPNQINPTPGDPWSRSLTLHELMHAVGVGHALAYRPEIMAERQGPGLQTELGYGDRVALQIVGCW